MDAAYAGHDKEKSLPPCPSPPPTSSACSISSRIPKAGIIARPSATAAPTNRPRISTAIYFLLARGERSHWHKVDAIETWHWHAGAPLQLDIHDNGKRTKLILGCDLAAGERPQGIVPTNAWQAAESLGDWTLVGCTVAPGFEFSGFELAPAGWSPA